MSRGKDASPLQSFVEALDRSDRLVLLLHYADELTPHEIGILLDEPASAIESRLQRLAMAARKQIPARVTAVA